MNPSLVRRLWLGCGVLLLAGVPFPLAAGEQEGVRVDVVTATLERADGRGYGRDIDRTLALKIKVKNTGFKPLPAGQLQWNVYVKRWDLGEVGRVQRLNGTLEVPALIAAQEVELGGGEFQIGGHMHGNSKRHVDEVAGWKVVVTHEGKAREFTSSSSVAGLDRSADKKEENRPATR